MLLSFDLLSNRYKYLKISFQTAIWHFDFSHTIKAKPMAQWLARWAGYPEVGSSNLHRLHTINSEHHSVILFIISFADITNEVLV